VPPQLVERLHEHLRHVRARSEIDFYIQASNACETGHRAEIGGTPSRFLYSYAQNGLQN
jgi:hypothetical protein